MPWRVGGPAGFAFPIHADRLRHACGYALANTATTRGALRIGSAIASIHPRDALDAIECEAVRGLLEVVGLRADDERPI
jgi:hypothetical protein